MTAHKVKQKDRKVNVLVGLTQGEIMFLDRKIDKKNEETISRSALIRKLIYEAMVHPELLDVEFKE